MENNYLDYIPQALLNDFVDNRVIPIIGAGFSKNADVPKRFSMPDWNELGKTVASEITDYDYNNDPIDCFSFYEESYSRTKLIELFMKKMSHPDLKPGKTYKALCELFTKTICTTNYDDLLEKALGDLGRPFSVIATEDRLTVGGRDECKVIKLHGDFNHPDRMVITERDYDLFLNQNPIFSTYIANLFISNTMLLIGYSLEDNDFRSIWQIINNRLGKMAQPAYCITVGASKQKQARYQRRNIRVINIDEDSKKYKTVLATLFNNIKEYKLKQNDQVVKSSDDRINEQMVIPAEENKLCFLSCAQSRIAQLSALIDPILKSQGVTRVRYDNMLTPTDNFSDVTNVVMRKSKAAIVDISDPNLFVRYELRMLESLNKPILLIQDIEADTSIDIADKQVISYSFDVKKNKINESFVNQLIEWCRKVYSSSRDNNGSDRILIEADRLCKKEEYSACIISAISELEYLVRKNKSYYSRPGMLRNILKDLAGNHYHKLEKMLNLRNQIVHGGYKATQKEAGECIDIIKEVIEMNE